MKTARPCPPTPTQAPPSGQPLAIRLGGQSTIAARLFPAPAGRPARALVVHFHGGAFVGGSAADSAPLARSLAAAGAVVVSVEYPLAPAHPFPAAVESGHAVLAWAASQRQRLAGPQAGLVLAGEEAGGNIAAAVALAARDRHGPGVDGQILISPMLDPRLGTPSLRRCKAGAAGCVWADGWAAYLGGHGVADHPYATPARALRLGGLPPALILTAEDDPLRDEALAYGRRLAEAGVAATLRVLPAPTGWPCALIAGAPAPEALHQALNEFLDRTPATAGTSGSHP